MESTLSHPAFARRLLVNSLHDGLDGGANYVPPRLSSRQSEEINLEFAHQLTEIPMLQSIRNKGMWDVPNEAPTSVAVAVAGGDIGKAAEAGKTLSSLGGILGAVAAWSCCIVPLILFSVGVSGVWIGNLTALAPYQPIFIGVAVVSLGTGFYLVYRKPKAADCEPGTFCASPKSDRLTKSALWLSSVLVALAVAFNYLAPICLVV